MLNPAYTHCGIYKEGIFLCIDMASYNQSLNKIEIKTYKINKNNNLSLKEI